MWTLRREVKESRKAGIQEEYGMISASAERRKHRRCDIM
jgi:hypothetical protein